MANTYKSFRGYHPNGMLSMLKCVNNDNSNIRNLRLSKEPDGTILIIRKYSEAQNPI